MDPLAIAADVGLVAAFGGVLGMERRGAFQAMLAQPLVAVPALAVVLGDPATGLWLGALLQLLWMSSVLFGANVPPNETMASLSIAGMVLMFGRHVGPVDHSICALAILLGAPLALLGRWLDVRFDQINLALAKRADAVVEEGHPDALGHLVLLGLARMFLANAVVVGVAALVGLMILTLVRPLLRDALLVALGVVGSYVLPALGLAVALSLVRRRRGLALAFAAFVAVVALFGQERLS
ncbi:MAG: PTS sugar transporter subunit IIC [Myxococcales bacterium]|nr:PTS sugar transporter subunit IIC [Myxococcales bacterium]